MNGGSLVGMGRGKGEAEPDMICLCLTLLVGSCCQQHRQYDNVDPFSTMWILFVSEYIFFLLFLHGGRGLS